LQPEQIIEAATERDRREAATANTGTRGAPRLRVAFGLPGTSLAHVPDDGGTSNGGDTDPDQCLLGGRHRLEPGKDLGEDRRHHGTGLSIRRFGSAGHESVPTPTPDCTPVGKSWLLIR
jgi:hypothetical protein